MHDAIWFVQICKKRRSLDSATTRARLRTVHESDMVRRVILKVHCNRICFMIFNRWTLTKVQFWQQSVDAFAALQNVLYSFIIGVKPMRSDDHVTGNYEDDVDGGAHKSSARLIQHALPGRESCDDDGIGVGVGVLDTGIEPSQECISAGAFPPLVDSTWHTDE